MKKILKWVAIIFIGLIILGAIFGEDSSEETTQKAVTETSSESEVVTANAEEEVAEEVVVVEEETKPELTVAQKNAIRSAESYLRFKGFSRDGLIQQLSSSAGDGYDIDDATIAVDSLDVDWNEQAAKSAQSYLDFKGFSCDGLIQQLSSKAGDKFTKEQATYGAKQVGVCD